MPIIIIHILCRLELNSFNAFYLFINGQYVLITHCLHVMGTKVTKRLHHPGPAGNSLTLMFSIVYCLANIILYLYESESRTVEVHL